MLLVHGGLAAVTGTPELVINPAEADTLAKPTAGILAELGLKPDPRFELAFSFVSACAIIYGPRAFNINARMKREAAERNARKVGSGTTVGQRGDPLRAEPQTAAAPDAPKPNGAAHPNEFPGLALAPHMPDESTSQL